MIVLEKGRVYIGMADVITPEGADRMVTIRLEPNAGDHVVMTPEKALEVASRLLLWAEKAGL